MLINAGRGGLQIRGGYFERVLTTASWVPSSLDVYATEPLPTDSRFWTHPNVVLTPHNAADTDPDEISKYVARQIEIFEAGGAVGKCRRSGAGVLVFSSPLPPRSGGEGSGVGGLSTRNAGSYFAALPPTPDPSPPRAMARGRRGEESSVNHDIDRAFHDRFQLLAWHAAHGSGSRSNEGSQTASLRQSFGDRPIAGKLAIIPRQPLKAG